MRREAILGHEPDNAEEKKRMHELERKIKSCVRIGDVRSSEVLEAYISRGTGYPRSLVAKTIRQTG